MKQVLHVAAQESLEYLKTTIEQVLYFSVQKSSINSGEKGIQRKISDGKIKK